MSEARVAKSLMGEYSIEEFDGGVPNIKQRTTTIRSKDIRLVAHMLDIPIDYVINWSYKDDDKRVFLTDEIKITYNDEEVTAVVKTEESIMSKLKSRLAYKKAPIPIAITEIQLPPRYYFTNENIIITHEKVDLPYSFFECDKKLVPIGSPLPQVTIMNKTKTIEVAIMLNNPILLFREKLYHMLPPVRKTNLSFKLVNSNLVVNTNEGNKYMFPMSCRDTWAILSESIPHLEVISIADEKSYPATIIMDNSTFLRFTREIDLLFKPFIVSK